MLSSHRRVAPDDTARALLRAIHDQPLEDTPRLIYADWLTENGHPEAAVFVRASLGQLPEVGMSPAQAAGLYAVYVATLVRPKPRGMHYLKIDRGLPLVAAVYPHDDLDHCVDRMPPHYCVQLVLGHVSHTGYQAALRHKIMSQVHYVQLHAVDEYDVLALADTRCADRPVGLIAPVITPAAVAAVREFLPHARLIPSRLRPRSRRQCHALRMHAVRFGV